MFYEESFDVKSASGEFDFAWALQVRQFVADLLKKHSVERIEFIGVPANQWKRACAILEGASRASSSLTTA